MLFGKPFGIGLIILQKSVAAVFFALVGAGLLTLYFHGGTQQIFRLAFGELHEDPRDRLANFAIDHLPDVSTSLLLRLSLGAFLYFLLEAVEAVGLVLGQYWVEIFIVIETGLFLPFEGYELFRHVSLVKVGTIIINLLILAYLIKRYLRKQRERARAAPS
ncbi:MAG TPA: DUF2127 domain-containing protein [Chloroflexota bacterium]|nr:DUF2127 domain-containing protein [Chloroflexota bacterium]